MKSQKNNKNIKNKELDKNLKLIINFSVSFFCICLIFIEGENVWLFVRKIFLGLFGLNSIFIPGFLVSISILKMKNGSIDKFRATLSCMFSFVLSSLIGIFTFPFDDFFSYFFQSGIHNAGVISGILDILHP